MNELEARRKLVHLLFGIMIVILVHYELMNEFILGGITIAVIVIFLLSMKFKIGVIEFILKNFEREEVRKNFPGKGMIFYLLGCEIVLVFFTKDIAMASIIILAIGDSVPNFVGMYSSRIKHPFSDRKFLEGAIAGVVLSSAVAIVFVKWNEALIAASVALFIEGIDMKSGIDLIDDNLTVPIAAAMTMMLMRLFF